MSERKTAMRLVAWLILVASAVLLNAAPTVGQGCPANSSVNMQKSKPPDYVCTCNPGFKPIGGACMAAPKESVQCGIGQELRDGKCVASREESLQCAPLREQIALTKLAMDRARLALNVYEIYEANAGSDPKPPAGYSLLSNKPDEMRKMLPGMPEQQIKAFLSPNDSSYRAAIYRDTKGNLVLAFRGTVDFVKEGINPNGPNAIFGRPTDFFTNAQSLGRSLKSYANRNGLQLEIVGHSLGGGMAIAASAASGSRATVFNPETFKDSALVWGDLSSASNLITSYVTPGEPLSSIQGILQKVAPGKVVHLPDWPGQTLPGTVERHVMRSVRQGLNQQQVLLDKAFADNKCAR
jgi:hypothetical protein